jgi:hypothetical protein
VTIEKFPQPIFYDSFLSGYTGNRHRYPQAHSSTSHGVNFQDFSKPEFASIVAPATKSRA